MIRSVTKFLSVNYGILACRGISTPKSVLQDTYIAIGSNVGDRVEAFNDAIMQLRLLGEVKSTSFLYQTPPMYVTDQEKFLNAACHLRTSLEPEELLKALQAIEMLIGRKKSYRNGPRLIDLDIIMYGTNKVSTDDLQIPHLRLHERAFVLRPLCDINPELVHPTMNRSMLDLLNSLPESDRISMRRVTPIGKCSRGFNRLADFGSRIYVCGVLNITPDSFSDGGKFNTVPLAVERAFELVGGGADMIDIGGESSRPGSVAVTVEEEMERVIPVIRALRAAGMSSLISVDTRNAIVARAAVGAGADMINDISGGRHDSAMLETVAELGVPIVMMHMRGTSQTMTSKEHCTYATGDCIAEIATELNEQLAIADSLMPRWMQLIDPGIGFSKGSEENLLILKIENMKRLKKLLGDRPVFFGSSRKRFLKNILENSAALTAELIRDSHSEGSTSSSEEKKGEDGKEERRSPTVEELDWATAGTTAAAVTGGAEIIRVHNVPLTRAICDVTKAILDQSNESYRIKSALANCTATILD